MARTLAEVDADLAALETQVANMTTQLQNARDRLVTVEDISAANATKVSKIIRGLKALFKRIKPNGLIEPEDAFDHWAIRRKMNALLSYWWGRSTEETDEIQDA